MPRVLVIESDPSQMPFWLFLIHKVERSAKVKWTSSPSQAERLLSQSEGHSDPYDLVIACVQPSDIAGWSEIWSRHKAGPAIFLFTSLMSREQCATALGRDEDEFFFVQKPLRSAVCEDLLQALLSFAV